MSNYEKEIAGEIPSDRIKNFLKNPLELLRGEGPKKIFLRLFIFINLLGAASSLAADSGSDKGGKSAPSADSLKIPGQEVNIDSLSLPDPENLLEDTGINFDPDPLDIDSTPIIDPNIDPNVSDPIGSGDAPDNKGNQNIDIDLKNASPNNNPIPEAMTFADSTIEAVNVDVIPDTLDMGGHVKKAIKPMKNSRITVRRQDPLLPHVSYDIDLATGKTIRTIIDKK